MMTALLRKDWRVYRIAVIGSVIFSILPYGVGALTQWMFPPPEGNSWLRYAAMLSLAAGFAVGCAVLMAAVYGGMAFATERRERSAEFLAMLPVRKSRVALSKLLVAVVCMTPAVLVHLWLLNHWLIHSHGGFEGLLNVFAFALLVFGLAWLFSAFLDNPALAGVIALGLAFATALITSESVYALITTWNATVRAFELQAEGAVALVSITVGALSLGAGMLCYVLRVRP